MNKIHLPPKFLSFIIRKRLLCKTVLIYTKYLNKFNKSQYHLKLLRKRLDTDIISIFLQFTVPENGMFSDQAVHIFQPKLLRT